MATYDNVGERRDDSEKTVEASLQHAKERVEEKVEEYRHKAADALEGGAERARRLGERAPGQRTTSMGRRAGETLDEAADYVNQHTLAQMSADCGVWMRRNPGPSLAMAAVAGFVVGRALRR
jgi:ElaB/YqjD/DUF883 family membrane-anchored ribosome-binding protein